ncbi:MAG: hypothetical protein FJY25_00220 [Betaproteobacteria bacterium]|nr:hypothetical protein [Betaproteobacteria bacterium]
MSDPDVVLYHNDMSVCAANVRFMLIEKGIAGTLHGLNLRKGESQTPEYLKLNPNGVVPTLVHHGRPIIESNLILQYVDEVRPDPPLQPVAATTAIGSVSGLSSSMIPCILPPAPSVPVSRFGISILSATRRNCRRGSPAFLIPRDRPERARQSNWAWNLQVSPLLCGASFNCSMISIQPCVTIPGLRARPSQSPIWRLARISSACSIWALAA